jgi:hypothetical protein
MIFGQRDVLRHRQLYVGDRTQVWRHGDTGFLWATYGIDGGTTEAVRASLLCAPVALPFTFGESAGVIILNIQNEPLNETRLAPARHRSKKAQRFLRAALELKSNGRASASISSVVVHSLSAFVIEKGVRLT